MNLRRNRLPASRESMTAKPTPIAEDAYWRQLCRWDSDFIDASDFAALLNTSSASIRQYRRRLQDFPEPTIDGQRHIWSLAQAYTFIERNRPERRGLIPRLYYGTGALEPASWVAVERHQLSDSQGHSTDWVVHLWRPADQRGIVAIAYRNDDVSESEAFASAPRLLDVLESVSAVVIATGAWVSLRGDKGQPGHRYQAEVVVADRRQPPRSDAEVATAAYGWFDVASLLRVNLPWWPVGLRSLDDIQAWRPGAAAQAVSPQTPTFDDRILEQLLDEASDSARAEDCRGVVDVINTRIEADLYKPHEKPDVPGDSERPGIFQAAFPRYRKPTPPEPPTVGELIALMNLHVPSEAARSQARELLNRWPSNVRAVVGTTISANKSQGPLAREWISRLKPCDDPQTLGSSFASDCVPSAQRKLPLRWWLDPLADFGWIVQSADGDYYATVGPYVPASGQLSELEVEAAWTATFFRAGNAVWPMPFGQPGYYTCGYQGTGPSNLAGAVVQLYRDAAIQLPSTFDVREAPAALRQAIETREAPLFLSEAAIDALMGTA